MVARRLAVLTAAGLLASGAASAYYHFVHFSSRSAPYVPVVEKFDLNVLPNKTVTYTVSEQSPAQLAAGDSMTGVVSQIRAAAKVWNAVETSDLRIAFGGMAPAGTIETAPGIDVVFDEVPPGLVALGGPTLRGDAVSGPNGSFVPIVRSVLTLRNDLSGRPSYSEAFFLTLVHEFGHTLGLQHTLTSSVMSTEITRATTKSKPLAADDIAGLSVLYPARGFAASTGVIAGRVTMAGEGVNLASVVALSPNGPVVSALTNPDGTYRIEGLTPGVPYLVYVHPLPPPLPAEVSNANIVLPVDGLRRPFPVGAYFETLFFPGTKDPQQAFPLMAPAGATVENVNFSAQRRGTPQLYAVQTYSFPAQVAVKPASFTRSAARSSIVATGVGMVTNGAPTPGVTAGVIGGAAAVVTPGSMRPYAGSTAYVQIDLEFTPFSAEGPFHMLFGVGGDIYVLPSAFQLAMRQPPLVATVTPGLDAAGNRVAILTGANLFSDTRFLFDGLAAVRVVEDAGRFLVTPPPAPSGHRAAVTAFNSDGQSSLFLQTPPAYTYDAAETPLAVAMSNGIPAGVEALVELNGVSTAFIDGLTVAGFGSSDVAVRRLWVLGPTRALANVQVAASALPQAVNLTVATGLQVISQPFALQVQAANPRQLAMSSQALNAVTQQPGVQAGSAALISVANLTQAQIGAGLNLTLNGERVQVLAAAPGQIVFQVPATATPGPAVLRLQAGADTSLPIAIAIDPPLPVVVTALSSSNAVIDGTRPTRPGDLVSLVVANLADAGSVVALGRVRVVVGGVEHQPAQIAPSTQSPGFHLVQFFLNAAVGAGQQPTTVSVDGRTSLPFALSVRGQ